MNVILSLILFNLVNSLAFTQYSSVLPFRHWHCIDFIKNIDKQKPYIFNVGDLHLISYFKNNNTILTNVNNHKSLNKYSNTNISFGNTLIHQNKLWWSYNPRTIKPPSVFFHNKYDSIEFKIDIHTNLIHCISNVLNLDTSNDIHHNIYGLTNDYFMANTKIYTYPHSKRPQYAVSYNYINSKKVHRISVFQKFEYPYQTWTRVKLSTNNKFYVNINHLPLSSNKTRLFVTFYHNLYKKTHIKNLLNYIIDIILFKISNFNTHSNGINDVFEKYKYPTNDQVLKLIQNVLNE